MNKCENGCCRSHWCTDEITCEWYHYIYPKCYNVFIDEIRLLVKYCPINGNKLYSDGRVGVAPNE